MRVLSYAWYIFDPCLKPFNKNYSGGGLVIRNLCDYIGKQHESYLFLGQVIEPTINIGNIRIVKTDYTPDMKSAKGGSDNTQYITYMTDVFERTAREIRPDIINFHDYGDLAQSIIKHVCAKMEIPYVITCHLYEAKKTEYSGAAINTHELFRKLLELPDIKIITVSNGMKRKILQDYGDYDESRLIPILNGTDFKPDFRKNRLKEELGVGERKILMCAGTICARKNQIQLLRIFGQDTALKKSTYVIFCGKKALHVTYDIKAEIAKMGLSDCMSYVGALQNEEMKDYYSIADGLVMPSYAEGLSISALEAIAYGLPVIMYADSECADDLNDLNVSCFSDSHSDASMGKAIHAWHEKTWDREYIINYAKRFTMEVMAENYLEFYGRIVAEN